LHGFLFFLISARPKGQPAQVNPPEPQLLPEEAMELLVWDPKDAAAEIFLRVSAPSQCGQEGS